MEMPSRGKYTVMFVFSFIFGLLWGLLSIGAYSTMNRAIAAGDVVQAQASAKKVKLFFTIGLIVTIVLTVLMIILAATGALKFSSYYYYYY